MPDLQPDPDVPQDADIAGAEASVAFWAGIDLRKYKGSRKAREDIWTARRASVAARDSMRAALRKSS